MFGDELLPLYWITAILAIVLLMAGQLRSLHERLVGVGFVAVGAASVWWLVRWSADSCADQFEFACDNLKTAVDAMFVAWVILALAAGASLIVNAVRRQGP
ncbi:MAG: hypothetical protein AABM66_02590 [Actinomycetota bacterium]